MAQVNLAGTAVFPLNAATGTVTTNTVTAWPPGQVWQVQENQAATHDPLGYGPVIHLQQIANGWLVHFAAVPHGIVSSYWVSSPEEIGDRIVACMVEAKLEDK